jgi:hypothetical protein
MMTPRGTTAHHLRKTLPKGRDARTPSSKCGSLQPTVLVLLTRRVLTAGSSRRPGSRATVREIVVCVLRTCIECLPETGELPARPCTYVHPMRWDKPQIDGDNVFSSKCCRHHRRLRLPDTVVRREYLVDRDASTHYKTMRSWRSESRDPPLTPRAIFLP